MTRLPAAADPAARCRRLLGGVAVAAVVLAACRTTPEPPPELGPLAEVERAAVRLGDETRPAVAAARQGSARVEVALPPGHLVLAFGWKGWDAAEETARVEVSFHAPGGSSRSLTEVTLPPPGGGREGWWETVLPVPEALAGRAGALVFTTPEAPGDGSLILGVPELVAERGGRPNLLLISIDTLRADRLGCYGNPRPTSPAIDALAHQGVRFRNAFAPSNWTLPSHYTMLTSLYPSAHGVNPDRETGSLVLHSDRAVAIRGSGREETLAERLARLGYFTAAVTEGGWVQPRFGFAQGFASYVAHADPHLETGTQARTLRWIEEHRELPFFLFVHTYETHLPYRMPEPFATMFIDPAHIGYALPGAVLPMRLLGKFKHGTFPPTRADVQAFRALYDSEIRYVDSFVEALTAKLADAGLAENTLVLLTSDHGEELFERGALDHGGTLYDEVLRVPLILWGPGRIPAARVVEAPVGGVDVLPTLVELAGGEVGGGIQGRSLVPLLEDRPRELAGRTLFAESRFGKDSIPQVCAWRGPKKLILQAGQPATAELFDLRADPGETTSLAAEDPQTVARLREDILAWQLESARLREGLEGAPGETGDVGLDSEMQERLRALGYL